MIPEDLRRHPLPGLERPLADEELGDINKYLNLLRKWQKTQRLVGSVDPTWLGENVVIASLAFLGVLPREARRVADVGSGAGVPGIVLAIVCRDLDVTLIEARRKRASFLSAVVRELGLTHVRVINARLEQIAQTYRATFDAAMMRCVESPGSLSASVFAIVRSGGVVIRTARPEEVARDDEELVRVRFPDHGIRRFVVSRRLAPSG